MKKYEENKKIMSCGCGCKERNHEGFGGERGERGERHERHEKCCKRITEEKKLAGARFELRTRNGCLIACARTGSNGECDFKDLPVGTYMLKEIEAPKGYKLDEKTYMVEISDDHPVRVVEVFNNKFNGDIKVIKFGKEEIFVEEGGEEIEG